MVHKWVNQNLLIVGNSQPSFRGGGGGGIREGWGTISSSPPAHSTSGNQHTGT